MTKAHECEIGECGACHGCVNYYDHCTECCAEPGHDPQEH